MVFVSLLSGCTSNTDNTLFKSIPAGSSGITFQNGLEDTDSQNIIEYLYYYNGGGVAAGDVNNDGWNDLVFTANQKPDKLYINHGDWTFTEHILPGHIDGSWSTGVSMADVDGDGDLDVYISKVSAFRDFKGANLLLLNRGDGSFEDVAEEAGLDFRGFSTQSAFLDFDRDGDLDMYLLNHAVHTTRSYGPATTRNSFDEKAGDRLFENQLNDEGVLVFDDITQEAGIFSAPQSYGLGLVASDLNEDGWIDIYVGNDFHENDYLYINQQNGTFREMLQKQIGHTSRFTMGVDVADLNGDQRSEIFSLDMLPRDNEILLKSGGEDNNQVTEIKLSFGYKHQLARNSFQLNRGGGQFSDIALLTDTYATDWSWSVLLADYDNDGLSDIFITNGIFKRPNDLDYINYLGNLKPGQSADQPDVRRDLINKMPTIRIPNAMFQNDGGLSFSSVESEWGLGLPSYSNGAVYVDLDNDTDLDIAINNVNETAFLFSNTTRESTAYNGLIIQLRDAGSNRYGLGATLNLYVAGQVLRREMTLTRGFQSSVAPEVHFGLGASSKTDSLEIFWTDGSRQLLTEVPVNSRTVVEKQDVSVVRQVQAETAARPETIYDIRENEFNDFNKESLIPFKLSTEGPAFCRGDIDGDGLEDLFLGGAHGYLPVIFKGVEKGGFTVDVRQDFEADRGFEDVSATFFDVDSDGDLDLYVVSGGGEFSEGSSWLSDRLYLNDGGGVYHRAPSDLPTTNGCCVEPIDFDNDGDPDLFVGSRSVTGNYGLIPESFLLENDKGVLTVRERISPGMVTDVKKLDYNKDGWSDLIIVGDWMPMTILKNNNGKFTDATISAGLNNTNGWWRSVSVADINGDSLPDFVAGNMGRNTKLRASLANPVKMYVGDLDRNGQVDPLIFYPRNMSTIPLSSRDELVKQIPELKKKFVSYNDFATIDSFDTFMEGFSEQTEVSVYRVTENASVIGINRGGEFSIAPLPTEAQLSFILDVVVADVNDDGHMDVLTAGNFLGSNTQLGRFDADPGGIFLGNGNGEFKFIRNLPVSIMNEYRHLDRANGKLIVVPNAGEMLMMEIGDLMDN